MTALVSAAWPGWARNACMIADIISPKENPFITHRYRKQGGVTSRKQSAAKDICHLESFDRRMELARGRVGVGFRVETETLDDTKRIGLNSSATLSFKPFRIMKTKSLSRYVLIAALVTNAISITTHGQDKPATSVAADPEAKAAAARAKSDTDNEKKAAEWVGSLKLGDATKEGRVADVIATHLKTIRDWHNEHPYTTVPAGINPVTGKPLSQLDRQMIANSAIPESVHENLMAGLRKDLTEEQVDAILDKYTVGKVEFTMKGYHAIVPDLTAEEEKTILGFLKQAREEAVDYKNMNQISAIFEIYKTKSEQYLNSNGRDWKKMYKAYTDEIKAKKAEAAKQQSKPTQ
jgi:hypothetical protein